MPSVAPHAFADYPLRAKLGLWLLWTAGGAMAIQALLWLFGSNVNILFESEWAMFRTLALLGLVVMLVLHRARLAEAGPVVDARWAGQLRRGFAIGVTVTVVYYGMCVAVGSMEWLGHVTVSGVANGLWRGIVGGAIRAALQQVLFAWFLVYVFRLRLGILPSCVAVGVLFGLIIELGEPYELFVTGEGVPRLVGLTVLATLLNMLRIRTGSIVYPAGLLMGVILVEEFGRSAHLIGSVIHMNRPIEVYFSPDRSPREAPVFWAMVAGSCAFVWWRIRRLGEPAHPEAAPQFDATFKRFFPFTLMTMLAPLDVWLRVLRSAAYHVDIFYRLRLVVTLVFSACNTVLTIPERWLAPVLLRNRVRDPVFIVGVHRSGTTHLQNMLALDPQFVTPRNFQVMNPHGWMITGWLWVALIGPFVPWRRPMDAVTFHLLAANEDEHLMQNASCLSSYWGWAFPRQGRQYDRFVLTSGFTDEQKTTWKRLYLRFLRKITVMSGKRPLLKNPANTGRVDLLRELFPNARFIYVCRNPVDVYHSNVKLERDGFAAVQLQDPPSGSGESYADRFPAVYRAMEDAFYAQAQALPTGSWTQVRLEDLERDARGEIRRVYRELGLQVSPAFRLRLRKYLARIAGYRKSSYPALPVSQQRALEQQLAPMVARWRAVSRGNP